MVGNKSAAIDSEFIVNISYRKHASRQTVEVYVVGLKTNFGSAGPRFPAKFCNAVWARKTRMMVYHAVKKSLMIVTAISKQYYSWTDWRAGRQTDRNAL